MLYAKKRKAMLFEAAAEELASSAEFIDPKVSDEVKDVIEELEDDFQNIETVDADEKETNGMNLTAESCPVFEMSFGYAVDIRDLIRVCESEEMEAAEGEEVNAGEVAHDVAEVNEVPEAELVIVMDKDAAVELVTDAVKDCAQSDVAVATEAARKLGKIVRQLKEAGIQVKFR